VVQQPGAGHDNGDPADLGVVAIPDSLVPPGITPATLPPAGALTTLRHGDPRAIVGFGCERVAQNGGRANLRCGDFRRRYTTAPFQALRPFTLALNANTAAGAQGGACFADSAARCSDRTTRLPERCSRPQAAATPSAIRSSASTARTRRRPATSSHHKASQCHELWGEAAPGPAAKRAQVYVRTRGLPFPGATRPGCLPRTYRADA